MNNFMKYANNKKRISLIKRRLKQGLTLTAISKEIEISTSAISHYCTRNEIKHDRDLRIDYDDVKIKKLIREKVPLVFIAEKLKIPYTRLYAHCKKREFDFIAKETHCNKYYDYSGLLVLANRGMTITGISIKLKIPWYNIYNYCAYHKINVKKTIYRPRTRKTKGKK